jgi:Mg2+ and Co2+ transporter CorA
MKRKFRAKRQSDREEKKESGRKKRRASRLPFSGVSEETAGLPPGSARYIGDTEPTQATYSLYSYDEASAVMRIPEDVNELAALIDPSVKNWININGLSGGGVEKLCAMLGIHPLVIEDILTVEHRPKLENYDDYLFLITKMLTMHDDRILIRDIQGLKRELARMRRVIWPVRDSISALARTDSIQMQASLVPYLRDLYENSIQAIEALESYREHTKSIIELHLTEINTNMSRVMKVLTILSAIFIPITFIAGVYGMNFHTMPELAQSWGYPAALGLMGVVVIGELVYFKIKKWI